MKLMVNYGCPKCGKVGSIIPMMGRRGSDGPGPDRLLIAVGSCEIHGEAWNIETGKPEGVQDRWGKRLAA